MRGDEIVAYNDEDYFSIGVSLLHSLLQYTFMLKQIEKEMVITKGWLKPSKLIQLTGVPAAELLKKQIHHEKAEEKKRKRKEKIRQYLDDKKEKVSKFNSITFT
jgi:hypothetical protein